MDCWKDEVKWHIFEERAQMRIRLQDNYNEPSWRLFENCVGKFCITSSYKLI